MDSKKEEINLNDKIPKERRKRTKETKGKLDEDGFFTTPNGSFWDMDGEYFNRYGFDIHGGKYIDKLDYIPGPTWIEELGCYPEDKDKYEKEEDLDEMEMEMGDCQDIYPDEKNDDLINKIENLDLKKDEHKDEININDLKKEKKEKKINKKDKKKKKKEKSFDKEEWEEIDD